MSTAVEHPFTVVLRNAALGNFPATDRRFTVESPLPGPCDAVAFLTKHVTIAADVEEGWVRERLSHQLDRQPADPSTGFGLFLAALYEQLGRPSTYVSVLAAASSKPAYLPGSIDRKGQPDPGWAAYRTEIESYRYRSSAVRGTIDVGRGPGGRLDVFVQLDENQGKIGAAAGRELLTAARTIVPPNEMLFGSAPMHDPRALRTLLGSGFEPVCTEALFLTRPRS